jgi:ketosteroid isomerase-like protein
VARAKAKKAKRSGRSKVAVKTAKRKTAARAAKRPATKAKRPVARRPAAGGSDAVRAFAQRIIDVTLGDNDAEMLGLYAEDVESSEAGQPPMVGLDALRGKLAGWRSMTTDTSFEPRRVLVDGNTIMIEWVGRVTLTASGRRAELHEVAVHEIRNGKIAREAFFYNPAALA